MSNPRTELKLEIRAFLDQWTPDCRPMDFRQDFKRLMKEVVKVMGGDGGCATPGHIDTIRDAIEDGMR